jgi:hypothetical protein
MLNRTNLTLSALSNRLNLGTRSLVLKTSVNHGGQILRIRHSHHDVMRERMAWYVVSSLIPVKYAIPAISGSFFPDSQCPVACVSQGESRPADARRVEPQPRPDWTVIQPGTGQGTFERSFSEWASCSGGSIGHKRRLSRRLRSTRENRSESAARPAAEPASAAIAAIAEA